jgi:hypothetical protein
MSKYRRLNRALAMLSLEEDPSAMVGLGITFGPGTRLAAEWKVGVEMILGLDGTHDGIHLKSATRYGGKRRARQAIQKSANSRFI